MLKAGQRLKDARVERQLTLEEISEATKIKVVFLENIENGEYGKLPSVTHAQGFVRNYAKYLGIPEKEILALFRREYDSDKDYRVLPQGFEAKDEFPISGFKFRNTALLGIIVFVLLVFYITYQYRYAFINPPLEITSPKDSEIVNAQEIKVIGKTDPDSTVYVNKEAVSVNGAGEFNKTITVFPGSFTLNVEAINKFGKTSQAQRKIQVKPSY